MPALTADRKGGREGRVGFAAAKSIPSRAEPEGSAGIRRKRAASGRAIRDTARFVSPSRISTFPLAFLTGRRIIGRARQLPMKAWTSD